MNAAPRTDDAIRDITLGPKWPQPWRDATIGEQRDAWEVLATHMCEFARKLEIELDSGELRRDADYRERANGMCNRCSRDFLNENAELKDRVYDLENKLSILSGSLQQIRTIVT